MPGAVIPGPPSLAAVVIPSGRREVKGEPGCCILLGEPRGSPHGVSFGGSAAAGAINERNK